MMLAKLNKHYSFACTTILFVKSILLVGVTLGPNLQVKCFMKSFGIGLLFTVKYIKPVLDIMYYRRCVT